MAGCLIEYDQAGWVRLCGESTWFRLVEANEPFHTLPSVRGLGVEGQRAGGDCNCLYELLSSEAIRSLRKDYLLDHSPECLGASYPCSNTFAFQ